MIKIVGYDNTKLKKVTCNNCSAILEYCNKDVTMLTVKDYGGSDIVKHIRCPNCGCCVSI